MESALPGRKESMNNAATLTDHYPTRVDHSEIHDRHDPVVWPGRSGPWPDGAVDDFAARGFRSVEGVLGAGDIRDRSNRSKAGGVVTAWFEGTQLTALNDQLKLKTSPESAYLTVYIRLHDDWRAPAGKLPGFSNTGNNREAVPCTVNADPFRRRLVAGGGDGGFAAKAYAEVIDINDAHAAPP